MKKSIYIYGQNGEKRQLTAQEAVTNYLLGRSKISLYEIRRRYGYIRVQMLLATVFAVDMITVNSEITFSMFYDPHLHG